MDQTSIDKDINDISSDEQASTPIPIESNQNLTPEMNDELPDGPVDHLNMTKSEGARDSDESRLKIELSPRKTKFNEDIDIKMDENMTEQDTVEGSSNSEGNLHRLPDIDPEKLSRKFILDHNQLEITSLDITSHANYVIAGCSNGMVILYDMTAPMEEGRVIAHIYAKGLHTNLLLIVKITEDCRFCFAGVHKGSSELLAIDLGRLPIQSLPSSKSLSSKQFNISQYATKYDVIEIFRNSDAKLRGFATASRVGRDDDKVNAIYRLACGRGIKNIHVWQFEPVQNRLNSSEPTWTCICDVPSNGMTIESLVFRNKGYELLSKSSNANIRFWDLGPYQPNMGMIKPPFEDISNSHDMKTALDNYAFGGTYDFAVVKISAPKNANRDSFELPERGIEDENGNRRKRMLRQIEDVIGTSDGRHVLGLCTDGGVMYYCQNDSMDESFPEIIEFSSFTRDPDIDQHWRINRVGSRGQAILLRAAKSSCKQFTYIHIDPLEKIASEVKSTPFDDSNQWSSWGYYSIDSGLAPEAVDEIETMAKASTKTSKQRVLAKSAQNPKQKVQFKKIMVSNKSPPIRLSPDSKGNQKLSPPENSHQRNASSHSSIDLFKSGSSKKTAIQNITPDLTSLAESVRDVPKRGDRLDEDDISRLVYGSSDGSPERDTEEVIRSTGYSVTTRKRERKYDILESNDNSPGAEEKNVLMKTGDSKQRKVMPRPLMKMPRLVESEEIIRKPPAPQVIQSIDEKYNEYVSSWKNSMNELVPREIFESSIMIYLEKFPRVLDHIRNAMVQQNRIYVQFISEYQRLVSIQYRQIVSRVKALLAQEDKNNLRRNENIAKSLGVIDMNALIMQYRKDIDMMIHLQTSDLSAFYMMDRFKVNQSISTRSLPALVFQYDEMFTLSQIFEASVNQMIVSQVEK